MLEIFRGLDQIGILKNLEMAAEIAVGQATEILKRAEEKAFGMRDERCQNTEACFLVDDPVESIVSKTPRVRRAFLLAHSRALTQ